MAEISVVIPTLGRHRSLERVLDRLERQDAPTTAFEVVVVIDAQEPEPAGVTEAIGTRPYAVREIRSHAPGASAARNRGWREASSGLILFLGDDIVPERPLVSEHLAWHRRHPGEEVGVLGHVQWARELKVTPFMRWLEHGIQFDYPNIEGIEAGWGRFYTANASLKRALVERVGGFDEERLPFLYEDLDLGYRMSKLGFRLLYNRAAVGAHLHPMDLESWRRRVARAAAAERCFVSIHPEIPPYFYRLFKSAADSPPARGRGRRLIRLVPRRMPWLGPRVWTSADLYYRQALAPSFLEAWARAAAQPENDARDLSGRNPKSD